MAKNIQVGTKDDSGTQAVDHGPDGFAYSPDSSDVYISDPDPVNHPAHYTQGPELCDIIDNYRLDWYLGNVLKYILRNELKLKPITDLQKARWYLDRKIKSLIDQGLI